VSSRQVFVFVVFLVVAVMTVLWRPLRWLFGAAPWLALVLLLLTAIFLIVLVLIQRGKGGGLSGAFGGMGGQSAFGTKAGDTFTQITVGVAVFWIYLCVVSVGASTTAKQDRLGLEPGGTAVEEKADEDRATSEGTSAEDLPGAAPLSSDQPAGDRPLTPRPE
jgi:preprotein translocase subunit SecG